MVNLYSGFSHAASAHAERPALWVDGRTLSYAELRERSARIAGAVERFAGPAMRLAAVFALRSETAYVGVLGALASGRGYVPLNPRFPVARTRRMLASAGCDVIIVGAESLQLVEPVLRELGRVVTLLLPATARGTFTPATDSPHRWLFAEDLQEQAPLTASRADDGEAVAYLLFTSGTTGDPKGVPVSHRNARSYVETMCRRYGVTHVDRLSQTFDLTFDLSVHDMFVAWEVGACVYCIPEAVLAAPARFIIDQQLTMWFSVPSTVAFMSRLRLLRPGLFPSLRVSLFCGEALPASAATAWQSAAPNSRLENLYGPTEATIAITAYPWDQSSSAARCRNGVVPIGWPLDEQLACVVNEQMQPVQANEPGELLLSGSQRTSGYWNNPDLTRERFVHVSPSDGHVWYRTGDRVVAESDGCLIYLGRTDHQVKVRGFRVELQEVEAALRSAAKTDLVAAVAWPLTDAGADGIVAFLCGASLPETTEILRACETSLPDYMIPRSVHVLPEFPLNANGKIDRPQLVATLQESRK